MPSILPRHHSQGPHPTLAPSGWELLLSTALILGAATGVLGQVESPPLETQVKADYLLNFTRYVEWPGDTFSTPETPLTICILGKDPFGEVLDQAIRGRRSQGRPLRVRRLESDEKAEGCHLAYLSDDAWFRRKRLIIGLGLQKILTVGDSRQFVQYGGGIGFVTGDRAVRFVINMNAMERSGLKISSRMLSLAMALHTEGPRF